MARKITKKAKTTSAKISKVASSQPQKNFINLLKRNQRARVIFGAVLLIALILLILPHLTIAWVDKKPITIFEYYHALDQKYGADTKEQLISERLVQDEAQKRGIKVSDQEINDQVKKFEEQASGSANLSQILAQQGLSQSDFRKQIMLQALVKKMFESQASVSAQEIDQYIEQNKDNLPAVTDDLRTSVSNQIKQQKTVQLFQDWLQQAQGSSRVVRL